MTSNFIYRSCRPLWTEKTDEFGLVFVQGRRETVFYKIIGTMRMRTKIGVRTGYIRSKCRRGGQSAPRFQRLREGDIQSYSKDVADDIKQYFTRGNVPIVKLVVLCGCRSKIQEILPKIAPCVRDLIPPPTFIGEEEHKIPEICQESIHHFYVTQEENQLKPFFHAVQTASPLLILGQEEVTSQCMEGQVPVLVCTTG